MITTTVIQADNGAVAPLVNFRDRKFTDIGWALLYGLSYIAFITTGGYIWSQSHPRFTFDSDGTRRVHDYYLEDTTTCCVDGYGYICMLLPDNDNSDRRLDSSGTNTKFNGDESMFDAFLEAPEIIIGLLSVTIATAIFWVLLLRFFSKPVVILTEVAKLGILITFSILQEGTEVRVFFIIMAIALIAYDYYFRKQILFAADILKHSTVALKANPSILFGSLFVKIMFAGNAFLFVTFFAKSFDVAEVVQEEGYCTFGYPTYVTRISIYLSLSYMWTIMFLRQMRLSIISTIVGSWHFHPNDKAGVMVAIINQIKSMGTLSVSALITTIAEKIFRLLSGDDWWKYWLNPGCCITAPINLLLCFIGCVFKTCINMVTKFALILHVFTGKSFLDSGKSVFKILSRHFKGGFVTETTSQSVLYLASYAFSIAISLLAWKWVDDKFDCGSLTDIGGDDRLYFILGFIFLIFNLWYPVLGLYIIIIANKYLNQWEVQKLEDYRDKTYDDDHLASLYENTNHLWIPPIVGAFVGCIAMMFFTFLADIFLDIVNTVFLCFAIDKDNFVNRQDDKLATLMIQVPGYIQAADVEVVLDQPIPVAPVVIDGSAPAPAPSAPPLELGKIY